jgi:hypothetical protein
MIAARIFFSKLIRFENNEIFFVLPFVIFGGFFGRKFLSSVGNKKLGFNILKTKRVIIVAEKEETNRIIEILDNSKIPVEFIGRISEEKPEKSFENLGKLSEIKEIIEKYKPNQIIFSLTDIKTEDIILNFEKLENLNIILSTTHSDSTKIISGF